MGKELRMFLACKYKGNYRNSTISKKWIHGWEAESEEVNNWFDIAGIISLVSNEKQTHEKQAVQSQRPHKTY